MPLIDYALNYKKITTELCENLNKPELLCNGFCYIKKEVGNDDTNSSKNKVIKNFVKIYEAIISKDLGTENSSPFKDFIQSLNDSYQNIYKNQFIKIIFHPPIS